MMCPGEPAEPIDEATAVILARWRAGGEEKEKAAVSILRRTEVLWQQRQRRQLTHQDLRDDLVQLTCIRVFRLLDRNLTVRNINAFIWHCAKYENLDLKEKEDRRKEVSSDSAGDADTAQDDLWRPPTGDYLAMRVEREEVSCREKVKAEMYLRRPCEMRVIGIHCQNGKQRSYLKLAQRLKMSYGTLRNRISDAHKEARTLCVSLCGADACPKQRDRSEPRGKVAKS